LHWYKIEHRVLLALYCCSCCRVHFSHM